MIKKMSFMLLMTLVVITISCKKGEITPNTSEAATVVNPSVIDESVKPMPPADGKYPEITFVTKEHNFGEITQGDKVTYDFTFKNTGEGNLLISNARGSCGCTVPDYPKEIIKPGESNKIKVSFDSSHKHGENKKSVILICNTKEGKEELTIRATINVPEGATKK